MMLSLFIQFDLLLVMLDASTVTHPDRVVGSHNLVNLSCWYQTQPPLPPPAKLRETLYRGMYGEQKVCSSFLKPNRTPAPDPGCSVE